MYLVVLLAAVFAPFVAGSGSPSFAQRERATAVLSRFWPLSEPALSAGRRAGDPEVRSRCRAATPGEFRDLFLAGKTEPRWLAEKLLTHDHELDGIPWAHYDSAFTFGKREDVRRALSALATELNLRGPTGDDIFGFEYYHPLLSGRRRDDGYPGGLDDLRFRVRGLKSAWNPHYDSRFLRNLKTEWAEVKAGRAPR